MNADGGGGTIRSRIKNLLRSPSIKLRRRSGAARHKEDLSDKVTLEKVLGITAAGNRALASDPRTGLVAYPAGCVVVLLNPRKNKQHHIFNSSRCESWSGFRSWSGPPPQSGHMPAVRVWDWSERLQVSELQEHKYGVACVAFSPNGKYIVSVGYQHDMMVNVWNWKKNVVVAANKVSSKVTAVSFSDDSSYFVTAGNRHVKFWYLDHAKTSKVNATVPLLGRSGLLGELRNNFFSDVACGRGRQASSTFCITSSGLLCEFNDRRLLDKWVELRASQATCLSVTEELIFCGCSDGTVRAFSPVNLHFLCTLPRPHCLGTDIANMVDASQLFCCRSEARYPDTVAVTYDPSNHWLSCVYNDHSIYVWDVHDLRDPRRAGKLYSALYHSSCVWSLEVYPEEPGGEPRLPCGSFLSCSSDNTIRLWNMDGHGVLKRNILSHDLQKVIYVDDNVTTLLDVESVAVSGGNAEKAVPLGSEGQQADPSRPGIRTLKVSPDGQHLASGDRTGVLRVHDLDSMEEILNVQAHDSEILCLEFSKLDTGLGLLASASRDRLIHVLDAQRDYSLVQTLDEHSSSITAVRFAANEGKVRMISCGADKSVYFRTAQQTADGLQFTRTHHAVRKTTLYDMDVEPTRKYAAVGCQDRSIRIFNISNGKQKKVYKGSQGEDGTLIKVQIDPSGLFIASSCSDKNISIFDFYSGECVASMFGHSEIVTGLKFSSDCRHLISVSGDSCIFVWRLSPELTIRMRQRLADLRPPSGGPQSIPSTARQCPQLTSAELRHRHKQCLFASPSELPDSLPELLLGQPEVKLHGLNKLLPRLGFCLGNCQSCGPPSLLVRVSCLRSPRPPGPLYLADTQPTMHWTHMAPSAGGGPTGGRTHVAPSDLLLDLKKGRQIHLIVPHPLKPRPFLSVSEFQVKEVRPSVSGDQQDKPSPDSGCSLGFNSRLSSPDRRPAGDDSELLSVDGNSSELEMEEDEEEEPRVAAGGGRASSQLVPQTPDQEAFLKEHFGTLADLNASGKKHTCPKTMTRTCGSTSNNVSHVLTGSPSRGSHSSSESLSISSRFLSQNPPGRDHPPQMLLLPQRPTTLPSSPRRLLTAAPPPGKPSPASLRSPHQEVTTPSVLSYAPSSAPPPSVLMTPRKSSSLSSTLSRSYMSPTASSMAKMSRSVSVGDAAVVPVVVSPSSSAALTHGNHGNQAGRVLQARVPGSSRPLPDKPTLASFSPSARTNGAATAAGLSSSSSSSSTTTHPPPVSVSPLTPPPKEEEPQTPAGSGVDDSGSDSSSCSFHLWFPPSPSSSSSSSSQVQTPPLAPPPPHPPLLRL
uniref:Mitogen-activated protein kinase binding protein 1 n=1 Tax=Sphaeramia orbicularis TaxID=375764 RepID=A0A673B4S2_9TELE